MADPAATVEQLEAELRQIRDRYAEVSLEAVATRAELEAVLQREAVLAGEAERSDRALMQILAQQRATAEVLRVIADSPTNLHGVLQQVTEAAARYCGADNALIVRRVGDHLEPAAWFRWVLRRES